MPQSLTFTTVELLEVKRVPKGGSAKFKASFTKDVISRMGWAEAPECFTGGNLEGDLAATVVTLTPKDSDKPKDAVELEASRVKRFQTVRLELENSRGKGHRTELRFEVSFPDMSGCRKLEAYMVTFGKGTLRVSYEPAAKQETLPGTEDKQGRLVTEEQARATTEVN